MIYGIRTTLYNPILLFTSYTFSRDNTMVGIPKFGDWLVDTLWRASEILEANTFDRGNSLCPSCRHASAASKCPVVVRAIHLRMYVRCDFGFQIRDRL